MQGELIIKVVNFSYILTLFVVVLNQNIVEFDALAHHTSHLHIRSGLYAIHNPYAYIRGLYY